MSVKNTRRFRRMASIIAVSLLLSFSVVAVYFISGGDSVTATNNQPTVEPAVQIQPSVIQPIVPVMNLEGVWSYKNEKGGVFEATVTSKSVKILMKTPDDTSLVYWNGTFDSNQTAGATVVSKVDEDAFILSKSTSKEFVVGIDTLTFDFTQAGKTKKVELRRG